MMFKNSLVSMIAFCVMTIPCLADTRTRSTSEDGVLEGSRSGKITICHRAKSDNLWEVISVSTKSLSKHMRHGDARIDDGIDCTIDTCDPINGLVHTPVDSECNDDDVCNGEEVCDPVNGCSAGGTLVCDDNNPCTDDSCDPVGGCTYTNDETNSCEDGDLCNGIEECSPEGECRVVAVLRCDDADACNGVETCHPVDGCVPGTPLVCDDGDFCNGIEICDPDLGCVVEAVLRCDDGDACNGVETCDSAEGCVPGTPLECDDGDLCTDDSCDSVDGCVNTEITCSESETCNVSTGDCELTPGSELLGTPLAINFTPGLLVDQLLVEVFDPWLTDPAFSLDIVITGINGGFEPHGSDVIDVIDTNVFSTNGTVAQTVVDWTTDTTTRNVNEVYTVCVQVLRNTTELIGDVKCAQFGPFF